MAKQIMAPNAARIKVIGVGGGGCNAVTRMVRDEIQGVEFYCLNTDAQALQIVDCPHKIQIGEKLTRGLGSGGDNAMGQRAAEESRDDIRDITASADMVFVTAGMGGGTGTGASPVVAEAARETGALVIGVVTRPFSFEGAHRRMVSEDGINRLMENCDTLIIVPNDRLLALCDTKTAVDSAFKMADEVLRQAVASIAEVITVPGVINLDFADVKSVMKDAGPAWMSIGRGSGANRAVDAAKEALASPLLDVSASGSKGVLFNIVGDSTLTLFEVNEAANVIKQAVDPEANIIFGVAHDEKMGKDVKITLIATGFASAGRMGLGKEKELDEFLNGLKKSEDELDVPSFLRQPMFGHRRQVATPSIRVDRTPKKASYL